MKKPFFYCAIFLFATSFLSAQSDCLIGLHGGITQSQYVRAGGLNSIADRLLFFRPNLGVSLRHNFKERFYWQTSLQYAQLGERILVYKGLRFGSEHDGNGGYLPDPTIPHRLEDHQKTDYLSLRAGLGYYLWSSEKFKLGMMPFAEANLFLKNEKDRRFYLDNGDLDSSSEYDYDSETEFRPVNATVGLALSLLAKVGSKFDVFLSPEASYQLQSATVKTPTNTDTRRYFVLGLSAGIFYRL